MFLSQADSQMSKDRQVFYDASLQYVFKIQEVQERKKFEFVEPVSCTRFCQHQPSASCVELIMERQLSQILKNTLHTLSGQ